MKENILPFRQTDEFDRAYNLAKDFYHDMGHKAGFEEGYQQCMRDLRLVKQMYIRLGISIGENRKNNQKHGYLKRLILGMVKRKARRADHFANLGEDKWID